jgi:hypothetical protein
MDKETERKIELLATAILNRWTLGDIILESEAFDSMADYEWLARNRFEVERLTDGLLEVVKKYVQYGSPLFLGKPVSEQAGS